MVAFIEAMGAPYFNVNGWTTSHWIPFGAFTDKNIHVRFGKLLALSHDNKNSY